MVGGVVYCPFFFLLLSVTGFLKKHKNKNKNLQDKKRRRRTSAWHADRIRARSPRCLSCHKTRLFFLFLSLSPLILNEATGLTFKRKDDDWNLLLLLLMAEPMSCCCCSCDSKSERKRKENDRPEEWPNRVIGLLCCCVCPCDRLDVPRLLFLFFIRKTPRKK